VANPKHTPEPWIDCEGFDHVERHVRAHEDGRFVASLYEVSSTKEAASPPEIAANAKRIIACVNACAGLEDPSVVPELVKEMEKIAEWDARGDEWEEATSFHAIRKLARAVLAKARRVKPAKGSCFICGAVVPQEVLDRNDGICHLCTMANEVQFEIDRECGDQ